ncbi:MAG: hypothetical protein KDA41_01715, partial [Planctomycetales bacterium]|nr:hypothetical protein [Planctomycetales bacterium]
MGAFDPYLAWLDIPATERPVNYYRLLGLRKLESDPATIAAAADRVAAHLAQFQNSPQAAACQQLLNELQIARTCLLDPARKRAYDGGLSTPARPGGAERPLAGPQAPVRPSPPAHLAMGEQPLSGPAVSRPAQMQRDRQISHAPPPPGAAGPSVQPLPDRPLAPLGGAMPLAGPGALPAGPIPGVAPTATPPAMTTPSPVAPVIPTGPGNYGPAPGGAVLPSPVQPGWQPQELPLGAADMAAGQLPPSAVAGPPGVPSSGYAGAGYPPAEYGPPAYGAAQPPPAWASPDRSGMVGSVVAGAGPVQSHE